MKETYREVEVPVNKRRFFKFSYNSSNKIVTGWEYLIVSLLIGLNVTWLALLRYKNPWKAFSLAAKVINTRKGFKTTHPKIVKRAHKYYMNLHTPGWPSGVFNRGINHSLNLFSQSPDISLFSLVFAITNKCGFQCEHCVEWDNLNRKDSLSASDLVDIINRFYRIGISQVHLSGGEPLNRIEDIIFILDSVPEGIDFWMFTNGYNLSAEKAARLKNHGLTGVIISLDHHESEKHDQFRGIQGSYRKALQSARNVIDSGLLLAFSCCATNDFISMNNLARYARICRDAGASFIQFLEPEAVGHYWQKNVSLNKENKEILEHFFYLLNFDTSYSGYPIASYPAMIKRQNGCPGGGLHFLYVDANGYVHACPFCKNKLFHASAGNLEKNIRSLRERGCSMIEFTSKSNDQLKTN
ncbi:radical SAM protein [Panacibacter ginsenosidivorans]|uniref:Radical SAM protein n=1 Tax=Panacibacter ginsenosidivorans TaxID=1813871 RepID=A0A5B8VCH2_9BACT|nr:radical SAM protein [Panacibacter ginsenosidivorans]QEC69154.1 radical SAM protein [Panacibacter ginsenosidivorans]